MIIIRTKHDTQTNYLYQWSEKVIAEALDRNYKVDKIEGAGITEQNLRSRIKNRKPRIIFFNGHGSSTGMINNKKEEFINLHSADVFSGTITFTRACDCLSELGPEAIKRGCIAFIGYKRQFWIARTHKWECLPLKDPVAKPILEGSNVIMTELLKGKTVEESVKKTHEFANKSIMDLVYSKEPLAFASLQAVIANDSSLGFAGDANAMLIN
jgi:hypothetical protein